MSSAASQSSKNGWSGADIEKRASRQSQSAALRAFCTKKNIYRFVDGCAADTATIIGYDSFKCVTCLSCVAFCLTFSDLETCRAFYLTECRGAIL